MQYSSPSPFFASSSSLRSCRIHFERRQLLMPPNTSAPCTPSVPPVPQKPDSHTSASWTPRVPPVPQKIASHTSAPCTPRVPPVLQKTASHTSSNLGHMRSQRHPLFRRRQLLIPPHTSAPCAPHALPCSAEESFSYLRIPRPHALPMRSPVPQKIASHTSSYLGPMRSQRHPLFRTFTCAPGVPGTVKAALCRC